MPSLQLSIAYLVVFPVAVAVAAVVCRVQVLFAATFPALAAESTGTAAADDYFPALFVSQHCYAGNSLHRVWLSSFQFHFYFRLCHCYGSYSF